MGLIERRYGIAGEAAGKAALEYGAGRKATDAFVLSRIARAVVDALEADDRGAVDLAERYGEAIIAISAALPNVNRVRAIIASLDTDGGQ
jgi:ATP-dependent RNA circularization protein (DNA/RNA ligase family)